MTITSDNLLPRRKASQDHDHCGYEQPSINLHVLPVSLHLCSPFFARTNFVRHAERTSNEVGSQAAKDGQGMLPRVVAECVPLP